MKCEHTWKSAHAWCVLDLKKQCIAHRWCQECKKCEGKSEPWFDIESLERMAEFAVELYLIRIGVREREELFDADDSDPQMGPPHDERRCDMCKQLDHSCWKKAAASKGP